MVLSDFLSRQNSNDSNPHEIIPILFNMYQVLHEKYYNTENYLVQTRSQGSIEKPHIGQGRAGLRRKRPDPINQTIILPSELS